MNISKENTTPETVTILGVPVHILTSDALMRIISQWLTDERGTFHRISTVNPEFIMTARKDPEFAASLQEVDVSTADGVGIVVAARTLGKPAPDRITGVEITGRLAAMDSPRPNLFLLGAAPGVAAEAGLRLTLRHPGARIAGTMSGSPEDAGFTEIRQAISESGADTLLVAFGAPAQEVWLSRHRRDLAECGIVLAIGVGGTFDYLSGRVPRAPRVIRRLGLEWLFRLVRQPWRWRRQLALPHFAALILRERIFGKG